MTKLGLALSGGGFRASLFHVGVLAHLAESGLLRQVEVLSCVSGGSILGALYYVRLKRLLETRKDADIQAADYVKLVEDLEGQFVDAIQKNIRMRTFLNPLKNLRMIRANYSRSDRIGELYDELLYRPGLAVAGRKMVEMRELKIAPPENPGFYPRRDNPGRRAKIPILLVNATVLNTGHIWRFEASTMGSVYPSTPTALDVDKNMRLLRPDSYAEITPAQQDIELGLAVAASAAVPGLFPPLSLSNLYPGGIRVQLVDGGVHDNQGLAGLLAEGCTHLVISDASGQLTDDKDPKTRAPRVMSRSNGVLMRQVREEELFALLDGRRTPTALLHLRKGLPIVTVPWFGPNQRPTPAAAGSPPSGRPPPADFGVDGGVQDRLSHIRTDLDSFTDVEATSLMLDGYLMSGSVLSSTPGLADLMGARGDRSAGAWKFNRIRPWMATPTPEFLKQLQVGSHTLFKFLRLGVRGLLTAALLVLGVLGLLWGLWRAGVSGWWLVFGVLVVAVSGLPAWLYLQIFDRLYLRLGRIERLRPPPLRR